jgi:polar amino acid transport system substrate-binding protein
MNTRSTTTQRTLTLLTALAVGSLLLAGCATSTPSKDAPAASSAAATTVSTPAINKDGTLSVCSALGMAVKPLFYYDKDQKPSGLEIEIAEEFAHRLGLKYQPVDTAFPSLIPSLQAHQCDVVMGSLFIKPEREKVVDFVPYLTSGAIFVAQSGNPHKITGLDDSLCGLKVAATVGASAVAAIEKQSTECTQNGKSAITLTQLDSTATGTKVVGTGQADAFSGSTADMYYAAQQSGGTFEVAGKAFDLISVGAAVNKGNDELRTALQDAFDGMKSDGSYEKLLSKWDLEAAAYTK